MLGNRSGNHVGDVYLIDFGSIQTAAVKDFGTRTVVGTYGYMPLEQFGDRTVPASDIYSLGATLIYLVTGTHPADLPQKNGRIQFEDVTSSNLSPDFTRWLKAVTEPTLETRILSASVALSKLQQPNTNINFSTFSKLIRGDWYWDGKTWIPTSQQLLVNSCKVKDKFKDKFQDALKLTKPSGSRITLDKGKDNLEILIPPIGINPSSVFLGFYLRLPGIH